MPFLIAKAIESYRVVALASSLYIHIRNIDYMYRALLTQKLHLPGEKSTDADHTKEVLGMLCEIKTQIFIF